jgi:hypothetical protein
MHLRNDVVRLKVGAVELLGHLAVFTAGTRTPAHLFAETCGNVRHQIHFLDRNDCRAFDCKSASTCATRLYVIASLRSRADSVPALALAASSSMRARSGGLKSSSMIVSAAARRKLPVSGSMIRAQMSASEAGSKVAVFMAELYHRDKSASSDFCGLLAAAEIV